MSALLHTCPHPYSTLRVLRATGTKLYDVSGTEFLDLTSGFGVAALGYSNPQIVDAVSGRLKTIGHAIPSLIAFENDSVAGDEIAAVTGFRDAGVVLTTSGAEAIEVALKAAFLTTGRPGVVVMSGAFHGQSIGTLRANAHRSLAAPLAGIVPDRANVLPYPEPDTLTSPSSPAIAQSLQLLESWLFSQEHGCQSIGSLLIEPMQNLAGYRTFDLSFTTRLMELCRRAGVLVIADEIFTGFGRCGEWTISKCIGLDPDIVCVGKALTGGVPGGACVADRRFLGSLFPKSGPPLHAPTFYNSPIVSAAIAATIRCIREDKLLERAKSIGKAIQSRLAPHVGKVAGFRGVRGIGAAQALVFEGVDGVGTASDLVLRVTEDLLRRGVLALNSGFPRGDVVTICPPLVITDDELSFALAAVEDSLACLTDEVRDYGKATTIG